MKKLYFTGIATLVLSIAAGLSSCKTGQKTTASTNTTSTSTSTGTSTGTSTSTTAVALTYSASAKNIITENCSGCHKGMTSYAGVKWCIDNGEFKELVLEKKTMPKGKTLSEADFNILKGWIEAGGKE